MADIELVIKISEGIMEYVKNNDCLAACFADEVAKAIKNGTQLPAGHGDLVDIEELKDMLCLEDNGYNRDNNVAELVTLEDLDRLDAIIEADKE